MGDFDVDGEHFRVTGRAGKYHYRWRTGPNGYGFDTVSNMPYAKTRGEHEREIREFLAEIDPETGYMSDD